MRSRALLLALAACAGAPEQPRGSAPAQPRTSLREVNEVRAADADRVVAIVGAMLVDGRGGAPVPDAVVVVRGDRIEAAGPRALVHVPAGADVFDATGLTLLPGLIDAHFHLDGDEPLPALFLSHGVTSVRDPGQWVEAYDAVRRSSQPVPRLFLTGPHLDAPPAAYPADSFIVRDAEEARLAVNRFTDGGASAIKIYFRLPVGLIEAVNRAAHARGIPTTAHLEIVDAGDAVRAGTDGIEHVTSLGVALLAPRDAERYRQAVLADNAARRNGRYEIWDKIDVDGPRARALIGLLAERRTYLSPTLAVFERRAGDNSASREVAKREASAADYNDTADVHVRGFGRMMELVGRARRAGVRVVVGSHSIVPHAERGWAYQRELELLVEAGLTPMEVIVAATSENARFFRSEERIGSVERGKLADLLLVQGDPTKEMSAMRNVRRVMLGGRWVEPEASAPGAAVPAAATAAAASAGSSE